MRKPKIHPRFFINLVGTNFRERWNVVEHATKDELENYISNTKHIKKIKIEHWGKNWWQQKQMTINESVQNTYMRKIWRIRHSKTYKKDVIYFNLTKFVKSQLKSINITNIDTINIDTFNKKNNFFSARQSLNSYNDDYGRNISLIMLN